MNPLHLRDKKRPRVDPGYRQESHSMGLHIALECSQRECEEFRGQRGTVGWEWKEWEDLDGQASS